MLVSKIKFPAYTGIRCLMMPYIQGEPESVPPEYRAYSSVLESQFIKKGDIGYLTIDESIAKAGTPHRCSRAKSTRALHTEVGKVPGTMYLRWGGGWAGRDDVLLDGDVSILLANNTDGTCAVWDAIHKDTSTDGDIGYASDKYPYASARMMKAGEVFKIGVFTPHESLPVAQDTKRQFLRIVSSGVHGRAEYFTENPLMQ